MEKTELSKAKTLDYPLDLFLPENRVNGFALYQILHYLPVPDGGVSVENQPQSTQYDKNEPQGVSTHFNLSEKEAKKLPPYWDEFEIEIDINNDIKFDQQTVRLKHVIYSECESCGGEIVEATYTMKLKQLHPVVSNLGKNAYTILSCLDQTDLSAYYKVDDEEEVESKEEENK